MSPISIPGKVTLKQSNTGVPDLDAQQYIAAVEAADGQALEDGVSLAIHRFVAGCKSDGIWDAIKASCILAGARTLSGALVPLVGTAPTNYNFVAGDYGRETGLKGDGSTKYLDSNRNNNADPRDDRHLSVYISESPSTNIGAFLCSGNQAGHSHLDRGNSNSTYFTRMSSSAFGSTSSNSIGQYGAVRSSSTSFAHRVGGVNYTFTGSSEPLANANFHVFNGNTIANRKTDARIAFYSIGESLDLALLDARVTTLMSDIGAAIP
jgi:hypothetical protein